MTKKAAGFGEVFARYVSKLAENRGALRPYPSLSVHPVNPENSHSFTTYDENARPASGEPHLVAACLLKPCIQHWRVGTDLDASWA